jgi:hypothetical protein
VSLWNGWMEAGLGVGHNVVEKETLREAPHPALAILIFTR